MPRSTGTIDLSAGVTRLVFCIQVTDRRGTVRGWTEHNKPLDRDLSDGNGTVTYAPDEGMFKRSAAEARSGGRVGSLEFFGLLDESGVGASDAFAGFYDSALVRMFLTDWSESAPSSSVIWIDIGELAETGLEDDKFIAKFKSLLDRLHTTKVGSYYQDDCIHVLGSQPDDIPPPFGRIGCRVQLPADVWAPNTPVSAREDRNGRPASLSGSPTAFNTVEPSDMQAVGRYFEASNAGTTGGSEPSWGSLPALGSTINDNGVSWIARQALREPAGLVGFGDQSNLFLSYFGDAPSNWYQRGRIVCTRGANVGVGRHIKSAITGSPSGEIAIVTWKPFPLALEAGSPNDEFELYAGCNHQPIHCIYKFRNFRNYGGMSLYAGSKDDYFKIPKQSA